MVVFLSLPLLAFGPPTLTESSQGERPVDSVGLTELAQSKKTPVVFARAFVVIDQKSGAKLIGSNESERLPMASTTKIMTALLAIEKGNLDSKVNISIDVATLAGSSLMGLRIGDSLRLEDLLYGLLLPSGNDAAIEIARHIGGSETKFVDLMNARAKELGLARTHFANPHGLDAPDHYTSALDLANLTRIALANPTFRKIVSTQKIEVKGKYLYELVNTNPLLGRSDVVGVKTGSTDLAGPCLVSAFTRDGNGLIVVELNSAERAPESIALADYAYQAFRWLGSLIPPSYFDSETDKVMGERAPMATPVPSWRALWPHEQ